MPVPLRLVHVASGDLWAGAEVQAHDLIVALDCRPDVVPAAILMNPGMLAVRLSAAGISLLVLDEAAGSLPTLLRRTIEFLRTHEADVVHTHRYKENLIGGVAAWRLRIPAVRTIHSAPFRVPGLRGRMVGLLDDLTAAYLHAAGICVSAELAGAVRARHPRLPLHVIENGIDVERIRSQARAVELRPRADMPLRVVWAGRLVPVKRPDLVLDIAAAMEQTHPGAFVFELYGDGPLKQSLQSAIDSRNLAGSVTLQGFAPRLAENLARADVLLISSDHEGLPMILLEALALELPVVAHGVGGMPEVLGGGRFGLLVDSQAVSAYARAIADVAAHPDAARQRSISGLDHLRARYSADRMADDYMRVYRSIARR